MSGTVYDVITNRIVESLKQNVVPWRMSWKTGSAKNLVSKKPYRGINQLLLGSARYNSPWFLTYKQALVLGGNIRKGEKSIPVIFWRVSDHKDDPTKKSFVLRYYSVFHASQADGIEVPPEPDTIPFNPIERAEQIVAGYKDCPTISYGGNRAEYVPALDVINLPSKESFEKPEAFYQVSFHEMIHSTGAKQRLDREGITNFDKFGSHQYSVEELIAECGSSFLAGEAGILDPVFENTTAYIQGWISRLQSNPKWIIQASGKAATAADYILGKSETHEDEETT